MRSKSNVRVCRFFKKVIISLLPLVCLAGLLIIPYVRLDPYADFRGREENYRWTFFFQQLGDLSVKKLISSRQTYNGFILGSSTTTGVRACYLQQQVAGSRFFHSAQWNESIGGICAKLKLLDSLGLDIRYAIVYIDTHNAFANDGKVHAVDHYLLTGETKTRYLYRHFRSFYDHLTLQKFRLLTGLPVEGNIFPDAVSDPATNDFDHLCRADAADSLINKVNSPAHRKRMDSLIASGTLAPRTDGQVYAPDQISADEHRILQTIARLFDKHKTEFIVVASPLYNQQKFSRRDNSIIQEVFGDRYHDLSGVNPVTNQVYNYAEDGYHFLPHVSKHIIDSLYLPGLKK